MPLIKPPALEPGSTIGIFTPAFPANTRFREKYQHGLAQIEALGFEVLEGSLTARASDEGYRAGSPRERAAELMALITNPSVKAIIATIGGKNSSSLIPYLDFEAIRVNPKIICGYSDVTSVHMAILHYSGLSTFYGPAVMPSFGEWPELLEETRDSFLDAVQRHRTGSRDLEVPTRWSDHLRNVDSGAWKNEPRRFQNNPGWRVLQPGEALAPIIVANLSTLMSCAGTDYFPDLNGCILLIESMEAPLSHEERHLRQLERMGVFDKISALIVGKPEVYDQEGAPFGLDELLLEILDGRPLPLVVDFDCGHTNPTLTIAQRTPLKLVAPEGGLATITVRETMIR